MRPLLNRQLRANSLPGESIHIGSVLHCRSTNAFTSENFKSINTEVSVSLAIEKPFWYEKLLKCVHTPGLTRFWVDSPRMHLLHQLLSYCAFLCMGSMRHAKPVACFHTHSYHPKHKACSDPLLIRMIATTFICIMSETPSKIIVRIKTQMFTTLVIKPLDQSR